MSVANTYRVETVEPTKAPRGITQGEWCRYVLASDSARVVGRYCGSLSQARSNAEQLAENLNARARTGKSPWVPRSRTKRASASATTKTACRPRSPVTRAASQVRAKA